MTSCRCTHGLTFWSMLALIGLPFACQGEDGPSQTSTSTGATAGISSTSNAGGASAAGSSSSAGGTSSAVGGTANSSGGASDTSTPKTNLGQIILFSSRQNGPIAQAEAYPLFRPLVPACPYQTYGDCSYAPASSTCNGMTPTVVSAGTITITSSASVPPIDVTIEPNPDGSYTQTSLGTLFLGGEQIHLAATGATVPAFSTDVTAPLVLLVNSPNYDASGIITASIQNDLVITFSRGTAGVTMDVLATSTNGTLNCSVDSQTNQLTIPAAALAAFGAGNQFALYTSGIISIPAGNSWSVAVGVIMDAMNPARTQPISVKLQ